MKNILRLIGLVGLLPYITSTVKGQEGVPGPAPAVAPPLTQTTVTIVSPPTVSYLTNTTVTLVTNTPEPKVMTLEELLRASVRAQVSSLAPVAVAPAAVPVPPAPGVGTGPTTAPPVMTQADFIGFLNNALANQSTNVDLFAAQEVELKLGGVYSTATGEGGVLIDGEYWGLVSNLGIGAQVIEGSKAGSSGTVAEFLYGEYRKSLGNVAAGIFVGGGYDALNKKPMGVVGMRVYYRTSAHLGTWAGIGFALESKAKDRGILAGGGISYSF